MPRRSNMPCSTCSASSSCASWDGALGVDLWSSGRRGPAMARAIDWLVPYLRADRPLGPTTKHRGTFTPAAEAALILRLGGIRLERPDYEQALADFPCTAPTPGSTSLAPPPAARRRAGRPRPGDGRRPAVDPYPKAFIVGCPKSGTVWVRDILEANPYTVVGPESHLFGRIYKPMTRHAIRRSACGPRSESYDASDAVLGPERGPKHWVGRDELERLLAPAAGRVGDATAPSSTAPWTAFFYSPRADGRTLVEKTPPPSRVGRDDPRRLARGPHRRGRAGRARRDHLDGTHVVGTRRTAGSRSNGGSPRSSGIHARATEVAAGRWHVIRFEHLIARPRDEIRGLFEFLELPWDTELLEGVVTATGFDRIRDASRPPAPPTRPGGLLAGRARRRRGRARRRAGRSSSSSATPSAEDIGHVMGRRHAPRRAARARDPLQCVLAAVGELDVGPETRSCTVRETSTSPACACAATRAPTWTAIPARSAPRTSHSPVCRPARTSTPRALGVRDDRERAVDRPRRAVEGGEEPVAGRVDLATAEPHQLPSHGGIVGVQQLAPAFVADRGRALGRADDVGVQDRGEDTVLRPRAAVRRSGTPR